MPSCQTPSHTVPLRDRDNQATTADSPKATVHKLRRPAPSPVHAEKPTTTDLDRFCSLLIFIAIFVALGGIAMIYAHFALK